MSDSEPVLQRRHPRYSERNLLLWLALGGLSLGRKLDGLLERHGQPSDEREDLPEDDPTLLATLGLIALRQQLETELRRSSEAPGKPESASSSRLPPGLLR
ncbi:MAG: hypothetical protein AAF799_08150 [Myxococcota bacterium]